MYGSWMDGEDIQILEEFAQENNNFNCQECGFNKNGEEQALKNLLTNYKELMKLKKDHSYSVDVVRENTKLRYELFRSIPVEKIEEKMKQIDKEYNDILSEYGNIDTDVTFNVTNENVRKHLDELVIRFTTLKELKEEVYGR